MFRKKRNYLRQIYKQNPETEAYIIEVSLDSYNEVFNGWDPSPIKKRDIEPDLLRFIEQCAYDIPLKYNVELTFYIPKEQYNENKELLTKDAILNNFHFIVHFTRRKLALNSKRILVYIILSFIFLSLGYLFKQHVRYDIILTALIEGLFIGGWVFLWEAFSLSLFSNQEIRGRLKRYERFIYSEINFQYV